MNSDNKPVNLLSACLMAGLALSLCLAAVFYFLKENEAGLRLSAQKQLAEVSESQKNLEEDMTELRFSSEQLKEKLAHHEETILSLTADLEEQRQLRQKAESEIEVKKAEIEQLQERIRAADKDRDEIEKRLEKQYEDYYQMKTQLGLLLKTKAELEQKAKELAENGPVSLGTVILRSNSRALNS